MNFLAVFLMLFAAICATVVADGYHKPLEIAHKWKKHHGKGYGKGGYHGGGHKLSGYSKRYQSMKHGTLNQLQSFENIILFILNVFLFRQGPLLMT